MIANERIDELKESATRYPATFHHYILAEDVLGLITRVETAEANAQQIAEQHIARANAGAIDVDRRVVPAAGVADVLERIVQLPNFEKHYGIAFGDHLRERVATLRGAGSEKAHG